MARLLPIVSFVAIAVLTAGLSVVPAAAASPGYIEQSTSDPVTAEPPVSRPHTTHCTVRLVDKFPSNDSSGKPQTFSGTLTPPPQCPGPWAKVVLSETISVSGRQYDRVGTLSVGGIEIYHGTTEEPSGPQPTTYTFSKDVTEFSSVLTHAQPYTGGIGNYTDDVDTGVYLQTVSMTYYRATRKHPAPRTPDRVVSIADDQSLSPVTPSLSTTVSGLPRNVTGGYVETTLEGGGCDEQWFTAVPNSVSANYPDAGLCGKGPYRESDITLDGHPVAATHTFPHIYSGGIVPTLWRPIPAIGTFDLYTESVDVTPFAGLLTDGKPQTFTVAIQNINDGWLVTGNLFLYTDHHATRTHGALLVDRVRATAPVHTAVADIKHGKRAIVTAKRDDVTKGYIVTSRGRITTTVHRELTYRNVDDVTDKGLVQAVRQRDSGTQRVTTVRGRHRSCAIHRYSYPLTVDYSAAKYVDDQNFALTGHVVMERDVSNALAKAGRVYPIDGSVETVDSHGSLTRTKGTTSESDGRSTSNYSGFVAVGRNNPVLHTYDHHLASKHGLVTKDVVRIE